jgi:hypothetical protein
VKHINVNRMAPRYIVELDRDQLREIVYLYLTDNDTRLGGNIVNSYCTSGGGFYILLEEETH